MADFKFDSKASVYKPIVLELEGEILPVRVIDFDAMEKLTEWDKRIENQPTLQYERLEWLLEKKSPYKMIRGLPMAVCNDAIRYILNCIMFPEKDLGPEPKNATGPGKKE